MSMNLGKKALLCSVLLLGCFDSAPPDGVDAATPDGGSDTAQDAFDASDTESRYPLSFAEYEAMAVAIWETTQICRPDEPLELITIVRFDCMLDLVSAGGGEDAVMEWLRDVRVNQVEARRCLERAGCDLLGACLEDSLSGTPMSWREADRACR